MWDGQRPSSDQEKEGMEMKTGVSEGVCHTPSTHVHTYAHMHVRKPLGREDPGLMLLLEPRA